MDAYVAQDVSTYKSAGCLQPTDPEHKKARVPLTIKVSQPVFEALHALREASGLTNQDVGELFLRAYSERKLGVDDAGDVFIGKEKPIVELSAEERILIQLWRSKPTGRYRRMARRQLQDALDLLTIPDPE